MPVQRLAPGSVLRLVVASARFATQRYQQVSLHWGLAGVDTRGQFHQDLACGRVPIPFPHRRVAPAPTLELRLPEEPMLCTLFVSARTDEGIIIARNFLIYSVSDAYPVCPTVIIEW